MESIGKGVTCEKIALELLELVFRYLVLRFY
jgi:hypothetical protein